VAEGEQAVRFKYSTLAKVPLPPNEQRLEILKSLDIPSPDELLKAAKKKTHPAHEWIFNEKVDWTNVGRREYCRRWIQQTKAPSIVIGGKTYSPRAVEWARSDGEGRWASLEDIVHDDALFVGYLKECQRMAEAMAEKLALVIELREK
jgi:hypothetical protein